MARNGEPVVEMTAYNDTSVSRQLGISKDRLKSPGDLDRDNEKIAELFGCPDLSNDKCIILD